SVVSRRAPSPPLFPYTTLFRSCFSFLAACGTSLEEGKVSRNASLKHVDLEEKIHQRFEQEITISAIGDMLIHSPVYDDARVGDRSEEHTSELQSRENLVCRLLL